jgi:serine protease Do
MTRKFGLTLLPNVVERTPAFIDDIVDGGLAASSGLKADDLIVLINDAVITSVMDVQQQLATFRTGQTISITVNRQQELKTVEMRMP